MIQSSMVANVWNNSEMEFHFLQQGVVITDEEKIHIKPVRNKDMALLKDLGFSSPHILFRSARVGSNTARGNIFGEEALVVLL